ncbi:hypothetical protein GCM10009122_41380 [Fulvivirga kasyanovii]|uniref:SPW repeat-containing integral membrane domain-containing protein n=1 Tax=Fulvivirga kasyanovii TaxID=396812 RepID=A0ABW9RU97_9BACT|nr:hypothetical protein [Fulvivirga kasyanovii]MTI27471.1 hypothetical protein [Fulvivirga kasyanovii]
MNLRFISPTFHGIIDYTAAVALIVVPFMLGLGDSSILALWLSVTTGLIVILVSTNTIYKYGIFQTLSFNAHLAIDLMAATTFAIAPFALGFEGIDMYYYIANAVVVFLVVALSDNCEPVINQ